MSGWFELSKSTNGQFRFVLKAENAQTLLSSEMYTTKASAENAIASVQHNCVADANFERKVASNSKHFFNLKAPNHQVIGTSQLYTTPEARDDGVASVKLNGVSKTVKDGT